MVVFLKDLLGSVDSFPVQRRTTIKEFKLQIKHRKGIKVKHQCLIFNGNLLKNGCALWDYHITDKATVVLLLKLTAAAAKRRRPKDDEDEADDADGADDDDNSLPAAKQTKEQTMTRLKKMFKDQLTLIKSDLLPGDDFVDKVLDASEASMLMVADQTGDPFGDTLVKLTSKQLEDLQGVPLQLTKNRNPDFTARLLTKHLYVDNMAKLEMKKTTLMQVQKLLTTLIWAMFNARYGTNSSMNRAFELDINQAIRDRAKADAASAAASTAASAAAGAPPARGGWFM